MLVNVFNPLTKFRRITEDQYLEGVPAPPDFKRMKHYTDDIKGCGIFLEEKI